MDALENSTDASAIFYAVAGTAKAKGPTPFDYLQLQLEEMLKNPTNIHSLPPKQINWLKQVISSKMGFARRWLSYVIAIEFLAACLCILSRPMVTIESTLKIKFASIRQFYDLLTGKVFPLLSCLKSEALMIGRTGLLTTGKAWRC